MKFKLSDVINLIGGGTPKTSVAEYWGGNIPWLSVKDFNNDSRYVYTTEKTITEDGLKNSSTRMLDVDDIIISARGTVGELAMIPFPMAFNQSCYGIRGKQDMILQPYLYYFLKDKISLLKNQTHGSVFDTVTRDTFANIEIELPAIDEQRRVGDILSTLDNKIESNKAINHHLEQMARAIFKSWFVDFEPWGGVMPSDWQEVRVGDLPVTVTDYVANGSFASLKENVQYLDTPTNAILVRLVDYNRNFNGDFVYITDAAWNFLGKSKLHGGEIIISNVGANAGTVFRCPRLPYKMSLAPNSIMISSALYENYLYYIFVSDNGQFLLRSILSGSAQPKFNKTDFRNLGIICPPNEALDKFNEVIAPLYEMSETRKAESQQLEQLRDTLLPQLMSGEISVTDLAAK